MLYFFEGYSLDPDRRELRRGQELRAIEPQVFDLLRYLIEQRERVVSKDDLIASIWDGRIVSDSTLNTRINAARTAIGDTGAKQRLIRTFARKGVRFVGDVREGPAKEAPATAEPAPQAAPSVNKTAAAERRELTVASCELLLGARSGMDPEDLREIVRGYHGCVADTARRYDGFVAHTHGYTASLFFGFPQAHEDDAERAVGAGLELIAAVTALQSPIPLQTRVGIATGLVVVADAPGLGGAPDIAGETPNIATRLHGIAAPDTVVVAESTRRLLGTLFELQDLGVPNLEGVAERVRAFKTVRPRSVESRFEALHTGDLTALVGREEELELLLRRWLRAKAGQGQVVLLSGEPGIGKSRLTVALLDAIAAEPHTRLRYFCSPQHTDSALYPIIGQMERAAGLAHDDAPSSRLDKLDALLVLTATSREDAALLAEMLSLSNDGRYPTLGLEPLQRRQKTLDALVIRLERLSRSEPVLAIFEDVHWIDPTSLEALGRVVERIKALPMLLIVTYRPEFTAPWIGQPHVMALTVNRLSEREVGTMVQRVADKALPQSVLHDIVERSDGIPLFIEEITKAALEAENRAAAVPAVPITLQASLMARLDRLGVPAKEVAQIGAAIGREFSHALVAAVVGESEAGLDSALERLIASGLLFRQGVPPHASYIFKHALVQDAAYGTLLREPRRALHARIAEILESQFSEVADRQPELLARHCTEAGQTEKAVNYWFKAGQIAAGRSANAESASHLTKALALVRDWSESPARDRQELDLRTALGPALIATRGYAADETVENYERCCDLIQTTADRTHWDVVLTGLAATYYNRGAYRRAREIGYECLHKAELERSTIGLCAAHRIISAASNALGDFRTAAINGESGFRHYDRDQQAAWRYVHDNGVAVASQWAIAAWHMGLIGTANAAHEKAFAFAGQLKHHNTTGYALYYNGVLPAFFRRDFAALAEYVARLLEHASRYLLPQWTAWASALEGAARAHAGKADDGILAIKRGIALCENSKNQAMRPVFLAALAEAQLLAGRYQDVTQTLDSAFYIAERTEEQWMNAELWRLRAALMLAKDTQEAIGRPDAEHCLKQGIEVAESQESKIFTLRLTTSLARLWAHREQLEQARLLLTSALKPFRDGPDTPDLKEAKALLDELQA